MGFIQVRMKKGIEVAGIPRSPGDLIHVSPAAAEALIKAGAAEDPTKKRKGRAGASRQAAPVASSEEG